METTQSPAITAEEEARYAELQRMALDMARDGDAAGLESMIAAGLPVNLSDAKGNTLLMLAAYHGHEDTVRMLIAHGAEVDRRNDREQTPLGGVAFKGNLAMARVLLEAGADIEADQGGGRRPLMFAAMFGHRAMVRLLIEAGADTRSQTVMGVSAENVAKLTGAIRSVGSFFKQ